MSHVLQHSVLLLSASGRQRRLLVRVRPADPDLHSALVGDGVAAIGCLICLGIAYHGKSYEYVERLGVLRKAQLDLLEWYEQIDGQPEDAAADFRDALDSRTIKAADRNALNNDRRTGVLYLARVWLFGLSAMGIATGLTYIVHTVQNPKKIPNIRIDNLNDLGRD